MNAAKLVLAALLLSAGCQKQNAELPFPVRPVPEAKDANGWPVYEQPADGFALSLPPGWAVVDQDPEALDRALKEGLKANPDFQAMEQMIRQQAATGLKLLGVERVTAATGFGTNVNLMKLGLDGAATVDEAVADALRGVETMATVEKPVQNSRVKLNAGEAGRLRYMMPVTLPGGRQERIVSVQYLLVHGDGLYSLTFVTLATEEARYQSTFESIAQTLRFVEK